MPKLSSGKPSGLKKSNPEPIIRDAGMFYCTRCGKAYDKQARHFLGANSNLYKKNGGYTHVCATCIDTLYDHYAHEYGSPKSAVRRLCMMFDIYWDERVYAASEDKNSAERIWRNYIQRIRLSQYGAVTKTYDDTINESLKSVATGDGMFNSESTDFARYDSESTEVAEAEIKRAEEVLGNRTFSLTQDIIDFWGSGLDPGFYNELEARFEYWYGADVDREDLDVAECAIVKKICLLEVTINRDSAQGKPIDRSVAALNTLLGAGNFKPSQKAAQDGADAQLDNTPFGSFLRMIENNDPIAEPAEEFKDVDGIRKYITVWFFGHLCKMLKIKNSYSKAYEDAIAALRVERPEFDDEDDEDFLSNIFDSGGASEDDD